MTDGVLRSMAYDLNGKRVWVAATAAWWAARSFGGWRLRTVKF